MGFEPQSPGPELCLASLCLTTRTHGHGQGQASEQLPSRAALSSFYKCQALFFHRPEEPLSPLSNWGKTGRPHYSGLEASYEP